ncbi:MAG: hypothetical protein AABZ94_08875 [Candidatus Eisenbacteria bacterium]
MTAASTVALVVITWRYTMATQRMVAEMRAARSAQLIPKLMPVLQVRSLAGKGQGHLRIVHAGIGPSFGVDVEIALEPPGPRWSWKPIIVAPNEGKAFSPEREVEPGKNRIYSLDELTEKFPTLTLTGKCQNALKEDIPIREEIDIREYWRMRKAAVSWVWSDREPEAVIADALREIRDELRSSRGGPRSPY